MRRKIEMQLLAWKKQGAERKPLIINCASVICSKMQEGAVTAVSVNAGSIAEKGSEGDAVSGLFAMLKDARIMNGDNCIL